MVQKTTRSQSVIKCIAACAGIAILVFSSVPHVLFAQTKSATLFIEKEGGSFDVGNTFSVSINVDTGGNAINAVEANLIFPPDKIQVVSPSTGTSFIDVWVGQPKFSNEAGTISFQGAIPSPGANTEKGLISTVTFRVKSTGRAFLRFTDDSKILLNDGHATNILSDMRGTAFDLTLPPPQGPAVQSPTHPDQNAWYADASAVLNWNDGQQADAYSFILDQNPVTIPDNVAEQDTTSISYDALANGKHYFHIRALRGGVWGGTTHFALNVDVSPPADFAVEIEPRKQTVQTRPVITFSTTDAHSGIDYYELKVVPRDVGVSDGVADVFFVEATSPHITELEPGAYDVIVRAYDGVGNFLEKKEQIRILPSFFWVVEWMLPALIVIIPVLICLVLASLYFAARMRYWHKQVSNRAAKGALSDTQVQEKLQRLKEYQKKYGALVLLLALSISSVALLCVPRSAVYAQTVDTPMITTYSEDVTTRERFYIGGKHTIEGSQVTVFLQRKETGETFSLAAETDAHGDWFYITDDPLQPGTYIIWSQASTGSLSSAPSAQIEVTVIPVLLRAGSSLLTKETIYLLIALVLFVFSAGLVLYGFMHRRAAQKKHQVLEREIFEAQQSIKVGFAMLRNDMKMQLESATKARMSTDVRVEEEQMEQKILDDLAYIEATIKKEVDDLEKGM